jgi:hypothetical protein
VPFIVILSSLCACAGGLFVWVRWSDSRIQRAHAAEVARLAALPLAELVSETRQRVGGRVSFPAASPLLTGHDIQSHEELLRVLKALLTELDAADAREQTLGRSSRTFGFHEDGLGMIVAALERRLHVPS